METHMSHAWTKDQVIDVIRTELLPALESASGVEPDSIDADTALLDRDLALDSLDVLDLQVALERRFGVKLPVLNRALIEASSNSVGGLAALVLDHQPQVAA
jgi:acyl carrier protein